MKNNLQTAILFILISIIFLILSLFIIMVGIEKTYDRIDIIENEIQDIKRVLIPAVPFEYVDLFSSLCDKYGVDPRLPAKIILCESSWNNKAKNLNSSAKGLFQFIDSTWEETLGKMDIDKSISQFNKEVNLEAGIFLISQGKLSHWESSRDCWKNYDVK